VGTRPLSHHSRSTGNNREFVLDGPFCLQMAQNSMAMFNSCKAIPVAGEPGISRCKREKMPGAIG
jgi:hypothetical protein